MDKKLTDLLHYIKAEGRICPQFQPWEDLWEILPDKKKPEDTSKWDPKPPVMLAAWREDPTQYRRERLESHIRYAAGHGVLDEVDAFLRGLSGEEWLYEESGGEK